MANKDEIVLFSGRFDRVHSGHVMSILRLGHEYKKVLIVILDYKERHWSAQYAQQYLRELCTYAKGEYEVVINKDHFATIPKRAAEQYGFDVYAAGNHKCLLHMDSLGFKVRFMERAYDYDATSDRRMGAIQEVMEQ